MIRVFTNQNNEFEAIVWLGDCSQVPAMPVLDPKAISYEGQVFEK